MKKATLASQFDREIGEMSTILDRARDCALLSKPWLLPEEGHGEDDEFRNNYQSVGSNGLTVFTGKLMDLIFPAGRPFFMLDVSPRVRYAAGADENMLRGQLEALFLRELTMMAVLESGNPDRKKRGSRRDSFRKKRRSKRVSFRTKQYQALLQCVGTGDVLQQLTDDYRIKVLRRDQWTCRRDSSGDVLHHILKEKVDILGIETEQHDNASIREMVNLSEIDEESEHDDRMVDMVTRNKYHHASGRWVVEQEINGHVFNTSEEEVSAYWSTPYELVSPEHHGRGLIENNLGDLKGLDNLELNLLNIMGLAGKGHPVLDAGSEMTPDDLRKPSGTVLVGRVQSGNVMDAGMLTFDMAREYTILESGIGRKEKNLGRAMLTEIEAMPTGDRVTATQIVRIAREIELATGGVVSSVADDMQIPLLLRLEYQMEKDKLIAPLNREAYEVVSITGVNAMRQGEKGQNVLNFAQIAAQMPEDAQRRIEWSVLVDVLARYMNIHEPGLIKTREQVEEEMAQDLQQAIAQQAASRGVDVLGNVAEQQMTQQ